jgi:hypothetical protein
VLTSQDYWRAIVLYGANVATYKIALGICLMELAEQGKTQVTMNELARTFFHHYRQRLTTGLPQQSNPQRKTVLEHIVEAYQQGELTETAAIEQVERQGFSDVVPRFHTVNRDPVPLRFYEATPTGLRLTDQLLSLFYEMRHDEMRAEVESRWDLLEAAFAMHLPVEVLGTDEHMLFRARGYERIDITGTRPVLNGYQNGLCFYCGEPLAGEPSHVDHVIPRVVLRHDEIWNLVLAHSSCNEEKSARLPARRYLLRLYERNEYYIASNHPIKRHLIAQLGATPEKRKEKLEHLYRAAEPVVIHTWEGKKGVLPANPLQPLGLVHP